jgi:adenosylmethionine-8-amino-7-oxononanoate aminotransferase
VVAECLERDMWIYPAGSGPVQDAVMIGCPLIVSESEIDQMVTTLREGIDAAARAA